MECGRTEEDHIDELDEGRDCSQQNSSDIKTDVLHDAKVENGIDELDEGRDCIQQNSSDIKTDVLDDTKVVNDIDELDEGRDHNQQNSSDITTDVLGDAKVVNDIGELDEGRDNDQQNSSDIKTNVSDDAKVSENDMDEGRDCNQQNSSDIKTDILDEANVSENDIVEPDEGRDCNQQNLSDIKTRVLDDAKVNILDHPDDEIGDHPNEGTADHPNEEIFYHLNEEILYHPKNENMYHPNEGIVDNSNEETVKHPSKDAVDESSSTGESDDKTVKIVVFGKDGAGKTALIVRLLTRRFIHEYDPTSEDVYAHHCVIDGDEVVLKIMDTAGMVERNLHEREEQIRWGDAFLLVLSLINEESLKVLHLIRAIIEEVNACEKPIALVANKCDLLHAREVTPSAVCELAEKWNCPAFETAATGDYSVVEEPFVFLYTEVMKKRRSRTELTSTTRIDSDFILVDVHKRFEPKLQETLSNTEPLVANSSENL